MAIETREPFDFRPDITIEREEPGYESTALDIAAAGFRRQNPLSNIDFFSPRPSFEPEPGYDPFADQKNLVGFEPWAENFSLSESRAETEHIKQKILQENADRKTLSEAGWGGVLAEMAGGVTNPVLWLSAAAGPGGIMTTIGQVALAEAASEVVLQTQQETRTWEESALNIAAAAAVTGVLSGTVHLLSKRAATELAPEPVAPPFKTQELQPGIDKWTKEIVVDGKVVGQVDGVIDREAGELAFRNQFVDPEARGAGLAGKAWKDVVDYALDNGMTIRSDSSVTQAAARPYEKLTAIEGYVVEKNPNAVLKTMPDGTKRWVSEASNVPVFRIQNEKATAAKAGADAEQTAMVKQMAEDIKSPGGAAAREIVPTNVNAAPPVDFVPPGSSWTPEQMASKADVPDAVAKHLAYGNPLMRLMSSPANAARSVTESLLETPMYLRKNREGVASDQSIETLIKVDNAPTGEALQITRDAFNESQGLAPGEVNFVRARVKAGWRGEHKFKEEVGRALRRGDGSDDPLVAQVAAAWRAKVFDPLKERAMKLELFPEQQVLRKELTALEKQSIKEGLTDELTAAIAAKTDELARWTPDPKGADSYLTRLYNYQKLAETADDFEAAVAQYLKAVEGYTEVEAKKAARSIHSGLLTKDNMYGLPKPEFRGTSRASKQAGGALQERTITLPDNILEPWLISDVEHVGRTYTRRMAAEINLAEKFGDRTLKKQIDALKAEYEALVEAAPSKKDKLILHNALRENIRDIEAMRDQIIGTYGLPSDPSGTFARGNRMARSWQYVVALGMQTISALPDMARPIVTNGLMAYARGLAHALPFMAKLAKEDVKRMGIGLDMLTSGRMRAIATMDEIPLVGGKFEHGLEELASGFGKVSGMDQWNSFWKQYSGIMAVDRIAQMAERGWTKLKASEQAQLNWLGIDAEGLNGIRTQFAKHGTKESGFNVANIASWDHGPARNLMAAANKEADTLIITPGKGDKPLLAATDIGKTLFQFQSFTAAATNRMLVSGIAQKDLRVVQGLFMGVIIGTLSSYTKDSMNGRPTKWAEDPVLIVANGLRQAGTLGLIAQIPVDVAATVYKGKSAAKSIIDAVPGVDAPAEGLIRAGANVLGAVQKGDGTAALKAGSKMLPYQNLFYIRQLLNEMGDGERSALGLRKPSGNEGLTQSHTAFGG